MKTIAVSGGIGSGKSVVCKILRTLDYKVYDCDSRARLLMDSNKEMLAILCAEFGEAIIDCEGKINRPELAKIVFADTSKLNRLNEIVHGEVRADLGKWFEKCRNEGCEKAFVETAILYQSGLDRMVDEVWEVESPERVRIERVTKRNSVSVEEVESRIRAQQAYEVENPHPNSIVVINDGVMPLLPQIESLLG